MSAGMEIRLARGIRYVGSECYLWLWREAPHAWQGHVDLRFAQAPLGALQPSGSWTDPLIVEDYVRRLEKGRAVAPLVVSETETGRWFIHDGNHRYRALQIYLEGNGKAPVRVARAIPRPGYRFRYRQFDTYGTYLLEPIQPLVQVRITYASSAQECAVTSFSGANTVFRVFRTGEPDSILEGSSRFRTWLRR